ncbi:MAG: hypothetical protein K8S16_18590 [Bacteroidales bacterium]|nr:hypothetical protein [Bacteroidales bacterium]
MAIKSWVRMLKIMMLAALIGLPAIYQSLHQVFSHHRHFECCSYEEKGEVNQQEEDCWIVMFEFLPQFQSGTDVILKTPVYYLSVVSPLLIEFIQGKNFSSDPARAPPVS